jgi:hypothetical protein
VERFLLTSGGQWVNRFLPINPFPSPHWCIDTIEACALGAMNRMEFDGPWISDFLYVKRVGAADSKDWDGTEGHTVVTWSVSC